MSYQAVTWALNLDVKNTIDKFVLVCLCHHADNDSNKSFPSQTLIANECSISISSVIRAVKNLQQLGLVSVEKKTTKHNLIRNEYVIKPLSHRQGSHRQGSVGHVPPVTVTPEPLSQGHPNNHINNQQESLYCSATPNDKNIYKTKEQKKYNEDAKEVLLFLNKVTGRNYRLEKTNLSLITARLKSGISVEDMRSVIAKKRREWIVDPKMSIYLRPKTLFNAINFEQYLGELINLENE